MPRTYLGYTQDENAANLDQYRQLAINVKAAPYNAVGDGVTDDTAAIQAADTAAGADGTVLVVAGTYRMASSATLSASFVFLNGATLEPDSGVTVTLAGPVTTAPGEGVVTSGAAGTVTVTGATGTPAAVAEDLLGDGRVVVIAGTLRQSASDPSEWYWIGSDENPQYGLHVPTGVSRVLNTPAGNLTATGDRLRVYFDRTFDRTISVTVTPDEFLAQQWGVTVGASVGLEYFDIKAGFTRGGGGNIRYDGADFVAVDGTNQDLNPQMAYVGGNLTVTHDYCPGADVQVVAWSNDGTVNPYLPILRSVTNTSFVVQFLDTTTGTIVAGGATTQMAFYWFKSFTGPANMNTADVPFASGNLWVVGIANAE